jgi:hypothetical protein
VVPRKRRSTPEVGQRRGGVEVGGGGGGGDVTGAEGASGLDQLHQFDRIGNLTYRITVQIASSKHCTL